MSARPRLAVLVVVDALRGDRLGRGVMPWLDALAARSTAFARAYAAANWTLPSMASLLTARVPPRHGALHHGVPLAEGTPTLAEAFRAQGARAAAFLGGGYLDAPYRLGRGFEVWESWGHRGLRDAVPSAREWLRSLAPGERGLLLVHGNDLQPVLPPPGGPGEGAAALDGLVPDYHLIKAYNGYPWSPGWGPEPDAATRARLEALRGGAAAAAFSALYDRRCAAADAWLAALWDGVRAAGLEEETVLAVCADHGFELGEGGRLAHGYHASAGDAALRVPLVLRVPGQAARRVEAPVSLLDLGPTLLELLGLPPLADADGRSLAPALRGEPWTPRPVPSWAPLMHPARTPLACLREERWTLLRDVGAGRAALHESGDAELERDLSGRHPREAARLARLLERIEDPRLALCGGKGYPMPEASPS